MKTFYTTLFFFMFIGLAVSQPIIQNNFIEIGDRFDMRYTNESVDPGPAGMDVTWDFSSMTGNLIDFTWTALDPAGSPFEGLFPTANVYFKVPQETTNFEVLDSYIYYENNQDDISFLGSVVITENAGEIDTQYINITTDPDILFEYPIEFGNSFDDGIMGESIVNFGGTRFEFDRTGTTSTTADGYGTLITPLGTFQNVLRVKRTETIEDRLPGLPTATTQNWERYDWMSSNRKYILFHTEKLTIPGAPDSGTTYFTMPGLTTSIEDEEILKWELAPNPADDFITITLDENEAIGKIAVYDLRGIKVIEQEFFQNRFSVPVHQLIAGQYLIVLNTKSGINSSWIQIL